MKEKIINMVVEVCEEEAIREDLDADLFDLGLMDSLGIISLLIEIEQQFGIKIVPTEIEREQISTVNNIIRLLEEKGLK